MLVTPYHLVNRAITSLEIWSQWDERQTNPKDKRMEASKTTTSAAQEQQNLESEITKLVAKEAPKWRSDEEEAGSEEGSISFERETELERLRSTIAQSISSSIDGMEHLASELQKLEKLLNSEVQRVKSEIDNALAGIKIITEAIEPWRNSISPPLVPSTGTSNPNPATAKTPGSR
jgi:hypothetical protein